MQNEQQRISRILTTILADSDRRIYGLVKQGPCTKKQLGNRTKFPSNLLDKILRQLSSYNLVKSIKRPQSKNMNVWVLYNHKEESDQREQLEEKDDLMNLIRKKEHGITLADLQKDAIRKGIKIDHFDRILSIMEMRGQIQLLNGTVLKRTSQVLNAPCFQCKLRDVCTPGGVVSPSGCPYLLSW